MKKMMVVLLALLLCLNLSVMAFAADTCFVAGVPELCGSSWQASDPNNAMTLNGTVYEKVYASVPVGDYQFKVVYNGAWKNTGNGDANVMFSVVSPCDVTITYDPATDTVAYSGSGIGKRAFQVTGIYVAGAKSDQAPGWLNGEDWNEKATSNQASCISEGIYSISYQDIPAGTYEFKFAADQSWTHSWGGTFTEFGVATDAPYNGGNIKFTLTEKAKVTLKLDLTNFDLASGGAKFTVSLNEEDPPVDTLPLPDPDPTPDPVTGEVYYVAGCKELCGVEWKEAAAENKMTKGSDGIWTKTFKQVPAGSYQLKVTNGTWDDGGNWGGDGPDGNYVLNVTKAGDVTVKFNASTKQITVDTPTGTVPQGPTYYVTGKGDLMWKWEAAPAKGLMTNKGDGLYSYTFKNLPAGDYEFKITDGTWNDGGNWGKADGSNETFKLTANSSVQITFKLENGQAAIKVTIGAPITADLGMLPLWAAALCATMGAALLLMNRKKLI